MEKEELVYEVSVSWLTICKMLLGSRYVWKIKLKDHFVLGVGLDRAKQIYYDMPLEKYDEIRCTELNESEIELFQLTSQQRMERLNNLV